MAVAVWGSLEQTPGYLAMTDLVRDLFDTQIATELETPFSLGRAEQLQSLFRAAQLPVAKVETATGRARFPSIETWVRTDVTAGP